MFSRARNCEIFANLRLKLYWTYLEPGGAVFGPCVVVAVHSAELCPLLGQTLPKLPIDTPVDNSELVELRADDEIVDCDTGGVTFPVF